MQKREPLTLRGWLRLPVENSPTVSFTKQTPISAQVPLRDNRLALGVLFVNAIAVPARECEPSL